MRVGSRDLVLVDNGDPIERLPLKLVGQPVCAEGPGDGFENIVAFTVAGDILLRRPAEIHLFQVLGRPVGGPLSSRINRPVPYVHMVVFTQIHS
jgi:hypothetical protein